MNSHGSMRNKSISLVFPNEEDVLGGWDGVLTSDDEAGFEDMASICHLGGLLARLQERRTTEH